MGSRLGIRFTIPALEEAGKSAPKPEPTIVEVGATVAWSDHLMSGICFDGLRARDVWELNNFFAQLPSQTVP